MHTYIHTYTHTYIHKHTYIHTHTNTHIHTNIHTYIHTYIHTHTYTYTHTRCLHLRQIAKFLMYTVTHNNCSYCHTCCLPNHWVGSFFVLYIWTVVWKTAVMTQYEQLLCVTLNTRETCDYMPKMEAAVPTDDHTFGADCGASLARR